VLLDADSPYHTAPLAGILASIAGVLPQLLETYRSGGGVPYAAYGQQLRHGIAALNRPMFLQGDPVGTLRAARWLLADDGTVLVADERVAETFTTSGDPTERFMYGWSVLHCLPATLADHPVEATGTVLRAPTVAHWAAAAGFTGFEVLPIDNPFWRFHRLHG